MARAEREVGPVDICVNNAGWIYTVAQLKDMDDAAWDQNLAINLTGTYNVTKAVFPGMRERRWGRIVCMASIAGLMGGFGQTAYATGKMGVIGFARSVALEGARYSVTANVIAPGIIGPNANLSPMYERMVKRVAMQREGEPRTSPAPSPSCARSAPATSPEPCSPSPAAWTSSRSRVSTPTGG